MSNIETVFKILTNNSADVEQIIQQFGGIGNVIRAAPALLRIMRTISKSNDPVQEAERTDKSLYYNEETRAKIEHFQQQNGLHADGLVGNRTWAKVEELLNKNTS